MKIKQAISNTVAIGKKAGHGVASVAGKAKNYASGISNLVIKDARKLRSGISKAVRSKIEINIIMPDDKSKSEVRDQDAE